MEPIKLTPSGEVLDGRNRLDALQMIGVRVVTTRGKPSKQVKSEVPHGDPYELVLALNVHRRHLDRRQRRRVTKELLRERPERSDRATARLAVVDHRTVGRIRRELESSGEIPHPDRRVGADAAADACRSWRHGERSQVARRAEAQSPASLTWKRINQELRALVDAVGEEETLKLMEALRAEHAPSSKAVPS